MNFSGLLPYQISHAQQLSRALAKYGSALDASDTGTGKTYVALWMCRELGIVPIVLGTKNGQAEWEKAANIVKADFEYINYEKVRGRRAIRGGVEVDTLRITQNDGVLFDLPCTVDGFRSGKHVFHKPCDWGEAGHFLSEAGGPAIFIETGEWKLDPPGRVAQVRTSESDWIIEKKHHNGSFINWKSSYTMGIFDEVHRCGGSTTLNSKLLIAAKRQFKFVYALSATAADSPMQMKALGFALGLHRLNDKQFGYRPWLLRHGCNMDQESKQVSLSLNNNRISEAFKKLNAEIFPLHGARMRKAEIPGFPHSKLQIKLLKPEDASASRLTDELAKTYELYAEAARSTDLWVKHMQALELLMVPHIIDLAGDLSGEMKVVVFVSYTETRKAVTKELQKLFGVNQVGWVDGSQTGAKGDAERKIFISDFQANKLAAMVCNSNALSESGSLHDPTGQVERGTIVTPQDSGRRLKQLLGRVDRATGANSIQNLLYFAGTRQEQTAKRVEQRLTNIELLNDADLLFI